MTDGRLISAFGMLFQTGVGGWCAFDADYCLLIVTASAFQACTTSVPSRCSLCSSCSRHWVQFVVLTVCWLLPLHGMLLADALQA